MDSTAKCENAKREMQIEIYEKQDKTSNIWLEQNLTPRKTPTMLMIEQMIENIAWKEVTRFTDNIQCRLHKEQRGSATHFGWMQNVAKCSISGKT